MRWHTLSVLRTEGKSPTLSRLVSAVRQGIRSCQHILQQKLLHFFRFLKEWTVSRLLKCIKSFDRRLEYIKIGFCFRVRTGVIVDAFHEIDGQVKPWRLFAQIGGDHLPPQGGDARR